MRKIKCDKKLAMLLALVATSAVTFTLNFTTAAFINIEHHKQSITIKADYSGNTDSSIRSLILSKIMV